MASFSVDEDLDKVWSRTLEQCQDIAKWDLMKKGPATVNEVIDKIQPKTKDPEIKDKAKAVLAKTLTCLQRFGTFIAQGASVVFGPSAQVMNGISFLITFTQEYSKVFSGFVTIMERMSAFLGRMKVYLDGKISPGGVVLDKRLRGDVYEVLHHFIMVLAHSYKLRDSKTAKAKLITGLFLFGDDQGVKSALADLEVKIANVSKMEITVILQEVSEAARDVRRVEEKIDRMGDGVSRIEANLQAEQDRRVGKEQSEQNAKRLKEVLQPSEADSWTKAHGSFQGQLVPSTGSWLLERHTAFQRWMDPKDLPPNVFVLSGGEGYGKSCLSSAVIHHLLDKYPKGRSDHHVAVAYYFFQRDAKEKSSVKQAIRDVLYQLTQYDAAYGKKLGAALGDLHDLSKTLDLWRVFVDDNRTKINNTFFIVLDGVDEPDSDAERALATIIENLMSMKPEPGQLQVRLFITGRPSEVQKLEERAAASIPEVSLGSKPGSKDPPVNEEDIIRYINDRLKHMDIFQTSANEEVTTLQNRIPSELATGVKGDFVRLGYKLDEISRCTRVRQISEILERASETREVAIKRQISTMNGSLTKDEIEDLNEIMNWILGAMDVEGIGWVDTECLEGVLLLKTGTPSVVSLAKQIRSKYTSLLDLTVEITSAGKMEFVTLVSDDIRQYLVTAAKESQQIQAPTSEVQAAEVAIVRRVVSTFCGDDLYKRFNFESFFDGMGGEKAAKIHIDEKSMHVKILQACLVVLCDKPKDDKDLKSLREYARMYFVDHLRQVDREALDNDTVKWIRTQLARILVEESPIDAWWDEDYYEELRDDWINDEDDGGEETEDEDEQSSEPGADDSKSDSEKNDDERYVDALAKWLRGAAIDGIDLHERTWFQDTLSGNNPSVKILSRVLRRLAERWFSSIPTFETFLCVHGLYVQVRVFHHEAMPAVQEVWL